MFESGLMGLLIGLVVLYIIGQRLKRVSEELAMQRDETVRLTQLVRVLDSHLAELASTGKDKHKEINPNGAYMAIIDRRVEYVDPRDED